MKSFLLISVSCRLGTGADAHSDTELFLWGKGIFQLTPGQRHCWLPSSLGILPGATAAAPDSVLASLWMEKKVHLPPSASLLCIFITDLEKSMLSLLPGGDWAMNLDVSSKQTKQRKREGAIAAKTKPACKIHMLIKRKTGWVCVYVSIHAQYWGFLSAAAIQLFPPVSDLVAESLEKSTSPIPWHDSPSLHNWVLALPPKAVLVRTLHL